jgi:hypothetical protein
MRLGRRRNYLGETNAQVTERRLNACEVNLQTQAKILNQVQNDLATVRYSLGMTETKPPEEG